MTRTFITRRRLTEKGCWLLISFVLWLASASGQSPTSHNEVAASEQEPSTLRVTTRLVQFNVIVQDKKGAPVTGLTRKDFSLLDQGQPQKIAVFSEEGGGARTGSAKHLPPNLYSNRFDQTGQLPGGGVTIVLFDALNTEFSDQAYAREEVLKFLRQLQPQDHVAIYTLTNRLKVLHEFTSDTSSLIRELSRYKGQVSPTFNRVPAVSKPAMNDGANGASRPGADFDASLQRLEELFNRDGWISDGYTAYRATLTSEAIEAIANHVARIPGRKNLVWVSGSFPIAIGIGEDKLPQPGREIRSFSPEIERAVRAMNQANLAIYPVDARGLMTDPRFSAVTQVPAADDDFQLRALRFATMNTLADRTGGRAFYNTNDIRSSVRRAFEDGQVTYQIGFYPEHGGWDGRFHEIKVNVSNPHLKVRFCHGYFALPDPPADENERKAALNGALVSPIESSALGVDVEVHAAASKDSLALELIVSLDPRQLILVRRQDRYRGGVDLLFHQSDSTGERLGDDDKHIELNLEQESYKNFLENVVVLVRHLPLAPGASTLRIVARDSTSGALGTVTVSLQPYIHAGAEDSPAQSK